MSSPVRFQKIESNIPIGCIDSLKSPFFDGNFVFSHLIQYKNFDEYLPEVGACAVKARGQELSRVGHLILYNTALKSGRLIGGLASRDIE